MDLLQNPFYILNASPRDNRQRIMELTDERSLQMDPSVCMEARSDLTNPRKRLSSEIAWLPGIGPKRASELLLLLESTPLEILAVDKLTSIARVNLLAAGLARLPEYQSDDVVEWINEIVWEFEDIDSEELRVIINEERIVSGFPEVTDLSAVETEIQERRRHYRQVIKSALDKLLSRELVEAVTEIVNSATDEGQSHAPFLVDDIVEAYELEAQVFLEKEEANIKTLVENLFDAVDAGHSDSSLATKVNQLIQIVKNWDTVAQPIQVSSMSRGLIHDASYRVAKLVRGLVLHMTNEHGKLELSQQLTNMLQGVFAEVGEVAERTAEDADALNNLAVQRAQLIENAKIRAKEWQREITYEAEWGLIFKDKLRISPDGIEWKGRRWNLDSITRARWGGTRQYVNGIYTGTTYTIMIGDRSDYTSITLKDDNIYNNFIDRFWKSVGVRLLTELVELLKDGGKYRFGTAIVDDWGITLERKRFFSRTEQVYCRWDEVVIWNDPGMFCIGKKDDKKACVNLSYQENNNTHILESAIRILWKKGGDKLSSILGE